MADSAKGWLLAAGAATALIATAPAAARPLPDPDLEPGFPVQAYHSTGTYHSGPAIHAQVGNIDADPTLEIVVTALANGPLYAWNSDGSPQPGWPVSGVDGAGYPAMGQLSTGDAGLEVFSGHWGIPGMLAAYNGAGQALPGWPKPSSNYVATPPSLADVNGDGVDEIFTEEEDWALHAYEADGSALPGWPAFCPGGQEVHTPAIADFDGDGSPEIVTASESTTPGVYLCAYHADGTPVDGFPFLINTDYGYPDTFPVIGDVDGDGAPEIVVLAQVSGNAVVKIYSANGTLEHSMAVPGTVSYGTAPALGDLNGDGVPEIVLQQNDGLDVWKGSGTVLPGWPVTFSGAHGNSSPVIGDVDGDGQPDIAIEDMGGGTGEVRVYSRTGVLNSHFPKALPLGTGGVPAIADIDGDGRSELVVVGGDWGGQGFYDKVWVYDLHGSSYGGIEWGQFGGDAEHDNHYVGGSPPPPPPPPPAPPPPPPPPAPPPPPPPPPFTPPKCVVPRVIGLRLRQARVRIVRRHCRVGRVAHRHSSRVGRVLAQRPRPGRRLANGGRVNLVIGRH